MSCKEKNASRSKHYTPIERKVFLQILQNYRHVIERKKSDGTTLREKDVAWNEICNQYNQSSLISQERTVQQLKKLWTNLKQSQREALTKEKQSHLATGGGSQEAEAHIDPDIVNIAPHLMQTAPTLFSSNMTEAENNEKREVVLEMSSSSSQYENVEIVKENDEDFVYADSDIEAVVLEDTSTIKSSDKETTLDNVEIFSNVSNSEKTGNIRTLKRKRKETLQSSDTEEKLRVERIRRMIHQEQQLADFKLKHEEKMKDMKEKHLQEINCMQLHHLKEMQKLELQINKSKLKVIESQFTDKENIDLSM